MGDRDPEAEEEQPGASPPVASYEAAFRRARALTRCGPRQILGIAGMPGSGKSTLAERLVGDLGMAAVLVSMDGFHLASAELDRLGRRDRKGAVDTFDAAGYLALLRRLRQPERGATVYAPAFHREIEEPVAGAIPVGSQVALVVTEGNYLLLPDGRWGSVRALLDEAWYVEVDEPVRLRRLIDRHIAFGKPAEAARRWALGTDETNAELVRSTRGRADLVVRLE